MKMDYDFTCWIRKIFFITWKREKKDAPLPLGDSPIERQVAHRGSYVDERPHYKAPHHMDGLRSHPP
jgi:hypothetical protein